jgi:hypothetical protein
VAGCHHVPIVSFIHSFFKEREIDYVIDNMTQKEQNIDEQIKVKLITVIDDSSRKRKTRKESLRD